MKPALTEQQAYDLVEAHVRAAFGALPDFAGRVLFSRSRSECADPTDGGPAGRYEISATYEVTGLDPADFGEHIDALVAWGLEYGFTVLADHRPADQYVFARHETDGFDLSVQAGEPGRLYLGATSPCVWPDGEPPAPSPPPPPVEPAPVAKPRPRRETVDDEDFGDTDWSDGGPAY
ncbi:hypothetical protein [Amycolatopsis sp. PS_44_ISF1]|uniref:hypothetical protein n=1 Tax=Amycolatopsis sp. PS_44_ISF1 TaxID=2974917 RepID=UPI0028DD52E5|nr:hypothetical protein [Amycolatopsis sp. PS_44_ISF1]MDT8915921.1 hypothetical protein [Amycolatopsis sp. PS_44_ISF1]